MPSKSPLTSLLKLSDDGSVFFLRPVYINAIHSTVLPLPVYFLAHSTAVDFSCLYASFINRFILLRPTASGMILLPTTKRTFGSALRPPFSISSGANNTFINSPLKLRAELKSFDTNVLPLSISYFFSE